MLFIAKEERMSQFRCLKKETRRELVDKGDHRDEICYKYKSKLKKQISLRFGVFEAVHRGNRRVVPPSDFQP